MPSGINSGGMGGQPSERDDYSQNLPQSNSDAYDPQNLVKTGDIEIHSLADLGLDDDLDLLQLQDRGATSATIRIPKDQRLDAAAISEHSKIRQKAASAKDPDLSIFDELDIMLEEETAADTATGTDVASAGFHSNNPVLSADGSNDTNGSNVLNSTSSDEAGNQNFPQTDSDTGSSNNVNPNTSGAADKQNDKPASETEDADVTTGGNDATTDITEQQGGPKPTGISLGQQAAEAAGIMGNAANQQNSNTADTLNNDIKNMDNENIASGRKARKKKKRKKKSLIRRILKWFLLLIILCVLTAVAYVGFIIFTTPEVDPDNIYAELNQTSTIHDDQGEVFEYVDTLQNRTNVTYDQLPQDLIDAFVSIEDKTFFEHNGFNIVRIFGAIKESLTTGKDIGGTSTITQQLARNLWLNGERTMSRKIREAYYTILLEHNLEKDQILEAYLNTIPLGYNTYGVQTAANAYFGCDVSELTLAECATLAALPKSPSKLSPLKNYYNEEVSADNENILLMGDTYTTVYDDTFLSRQHLVLKNMLEQNKITQEEYDMAIAEDMKADMHPTPDTQIVSSYFSDYCLEEVKEDLMEQYNTNEDSVEKILRSGIHVYSTLNVEMQQIAEEEFSKNSNFPRINPNKDSRGNIIDSDHNILLYSRSNMFDSDGIFTLHDDEFRVADDGSLTLLAGKRLAFYNINAGNGSKEEQIEFKKFYYMENGILYSVNGGVIGNIDKKYKTKDSDGNLVISGEFMNSEKNIFLYDGNTVSVDPSAYTLRQATIQPQSSMVVTEFSTGQIKVMVGGRSLKGKLLYNRADNPRQPGSSIKPIGVYGPAIQSGVDKGTGWTAGSTIEDAPNIVNGRTWPTNTPNRYDGWVTLRYCVENSKNVPSVKLINDIGYDYSIDFLKKNGISTIVEDGATNDKNAAALGLGGMTQGISPLEMASAYGTFPNGGTHVEPTTYTKVTDAQGNILLEKNPEETKVFDETVAFIMTDILKTTVTNGIARRAAIGIMPVGGKTGTTSDNYDAWFVGFTPQFSASIWIGTDINMELSQGSAVAATLWSRIMRQLAPFGTETSSFRSMPSGIYVRGGEYYVEGTSPTGKAAGTGSSSSKSNKTNQQKYLTDEDGRRYYIDANTGERVYVTESSDDQNSSSTEQNDGTNNSSTQTNPSTAPNSGSQNGQTPSESPNQNTGTQHPATPPGVVNDPQ